MLSIYVATLFTRELYRTVGFSDTHSKIETQEMLTIAGQWNIVWDILWGLINSCTLISLVKLVQYVKACVIFISTIYKKLSKCFLFFNAIIFIPTVTNLFCMTNRFKKSEQLDVL